MPKKAKKQEIREDLEYAKTGSSRRKKVDQWVDAAQQFVQMINEEKKEPKQNIEKIDDDLLKKMGAQ
jgi:hypothetical protein